MEIRRGHVDDWDAATELAWITFLRFEAADYGEEGTTSFRNFLSDALLRRMFLMGEYLLFVATIDEHIVGMITLRNTNHISLLFVDEAYHHRGIGTALIEYACEYLRGEHQWKITIDAAPYAVDFYHRLGFRDMSEEKLAEGIRYTPMSKLL
ncbi:MAG: GNAT family N-acetyltransferase [Lachnospiraceae bacterium]|nr:GNAT family N-acetyltransferase [Lachnospiraceae bacterium]